MRTDASRSAEAVPAIDAFDRRNVGIVTAVPILKCLEQVVDRGAAGRTVRTQSG
jgi:hypothetical protein